MHAANDLDGKALLCTAYNKAMTHPVYGLVFDKEKVLKWQVKGTLVGSLTDPEQIHRRKKAKITLLAVIHLTSPKFY